MPTEAISAQATSTEAIETARPCAVVPIYNHATALPNTLNALHEAGLAIVVVNDGSALECSDFLRGLTTELAHIELYLVEHDINQGKGAAFLTGMKHALQLGFSHALQIDADGQHDNNDIPAMLALMNNEPGALIVAYPAYDETIPKLRFYGRYLTHVWVWIHTLSLSIKDSMCGFRIYPLVEAISLMEEENVAKRMDFDCDFIVRWFWRGYGLSQMESKVIYPEDGASSFRLVRDNILITKMHTRLFFGMLRRLPSLLANKRNAHGSQGNR